MRHATISTALALTLFACGDGPGPRECIEPQPTGAVDIGDILADLDGLDFDAFLAASYDQLLLRSPETVTELGMSAELGLADDRLDDISAPYVAATYDLIGGILTRLRAYDRTALSSAQQLSYDIYEWHLDDRGRQRQYEHFHYPVSPSVVALHSGLLLFLEDLHPVTDVASAAAYVERLRQISVKLGQLIDNLYASEAAGVITPRSLLEWARPQLTAISAVGDARDLAIYQTFATRLAAAAAISSAERDQLLDDAAAAIDCHVIPAFANLVSAVDDLMTRAPTAIGVGQFTDGGAYYAQTLRHHTTTDLDADAIHALGIAELDRIHAEMRTNFDTLGYPTDATLPQLFGRVVDDGGIIAADQVVATYENIISAAEADLADAFYNPPPIPVVVIGGPVGGFYVSGTPDGSRPGAFYARNTSPEARYGMATLAYHEAIPGHHLQISLAQALELPKLRRYMHFTGYIEGWAHYAERLAADLGWYEGDVYGDLGRLQGEAFRAARLVVDTGIHDQGWSFDQATDYMVDNIGYSRASMQGQVARYMGWPGQATAYRVGMLRLLELRELAEDELGASYDLRDFHAAVLDAGSMPLAILDEVVAAYIAAQ